MVVKTELDKITGWFAIPDLPEHRVARFLSPEEKEWAATRLGKAEQSTWDRTVFRRVLLSWQFYLLPLVFMRRSSFIHIHSASQLANLTKSTLSSYKLWETMSCRCGWHLVVIV